MSKRAADFAWAIVAGVCVGLAAGPAWAPLSIDVPEPASMTLLATGVGALLALRARRKK